MTKGNVLGAFDEVKIREALFAALSRYHQNHPRSRTISSQIALRMLAEELALGGGDPTEHHRLADEVDSNQGGLEEHPSLHHLHQEHPDNRKLLAAVWHWTMAGVVVPRFFMRKPGYQDAIDMLSITDRGARALSGGSDHPSRPGFTARFRDACPKAPSEVHAAVEDAVVCVAQQLARPAVVMAGLAFEMTLKHALNAFIERNLCKPPSSQNAVSVLKKVHEAISKWQDREQKHRLKLAVSTAEAIRQRRNEAAHSGASSIQVEDAEDLVLLAARHIPPFWQYAIR